MNDEDNDSLLALAQKIAEGSTVDAEREKLAAPAGTDAATLQSLLEIAAISAAHREAEQSLDRLWSESPPVPRHWGHLIILERIDGGKFGEVYRAHDTRLQIDVALKLSSPEASGSGESSHVLDEARLLAKVRHENVVRVYGADRKEGRVGLWMDLVKGQTLEELTKKQGFSEREAINVGIELCRGLAAVHQVGVLHGDIKAHNVIRQDGGRYVIVDFGAGRPLATTPAAGRDVIGTPVYLAPEVIAGEPRSTASDIYSLGVLLFHLVTNDYPVYATSHAGLIKAHNTGPRKRLRDLRGDLSDEFIRLIERATANDSRDRFSSAGEFQGALVEAMTPGLSGGGRKTPRKYGWAIWGVAATVVLLVGVAALRQSAPDKPNGENRNGEPVAAQPADVNLQPSGSYDIEASFYRVRGETDEPLTSTSRLRVKDQLRMSVQTSVPTYLYVVNEDEKGNAFLLYPPLSGADPQPLPSNTKLRLPANDNWLVDTVGEKEHFLVFASIEPLTAFEDTFKKLPAPRNPVGPPRLPAGTVERFRGVGGLAPASVGGMAHPESTIATRFRDVFRTPLVGRETTRGLWVRQLTVSNAE